MLKALAKQLREDLNTIKLAYPEVNKDNNNNNNKTGYFSFLWGSSEAKDSKGPKDSSTSSKYISVSLAWKWTPSENTHYDKGKYKGTVGQLCKILGMSKKEYRVASSFMRTYLGVVEAKMCGKDWENIDFSKVPSRAMNIYKKAYAKHQKERFGKYIEGVSTGTEKMNVGTLQPHEIIGQYLSVNSPTVNCTSEKPDVEAQWTAFVKKIGERGVSFDNSVSVVDTSASMSFEGGIPMKVAFALGLLTSHFCTGLFHNKWIEFSENAKLHKFPEGSLFDKLKSVKSIVQCTNIQSVFELILNTYEMFDVPVDKQIQRMFIFTDGQWDSMATNNDKTTFQVIEQNYEKAGYKRPTLIFWNLRANTIDFPVFNDAPDTALVSGFSSDLLQLFMDGGDMNPLSLVHKALHDERYDRVVM